MDFTEYQSGVCSILRQDGDGKHDPCMGDHPKSWSKRLRNVPQYPDEWLLIYNDAGGIHTQTQVKPYKMEIQVQSFAYATNDEINNMTFQRYKLINRANPKYW